MIDQATIQNFFLYWQKFINDIKLRYVNFDFLNERDKIIFPFNNVDSNICKKLGYFAYEALQVRNNVYH